MDGINLAAPIEFETSGEAQQFANRHKCYCLRHLIVRHSGERKWRVGCPQHGPVTEAETVCNHAAEMAHQNECIGAVDLRVKRNRKPEEILKELGF